MLDTIKLVILPLYRIESEYSFSVFNNLDNQNNTLSLEWLNDNLPHIFSKFKVIDISIEGGEISLLSDIYFDLLFKLLQTFDKKISISTDFSKFNKSLINNADVINVLYNFNHLSDTVFKNIKAAVSTGKIINIKSIDAFITNDFLGKITNLNRLKIKAWKIIPYQKTQNIPSFDYTIEHYSFIIQELLKLTDYMQFSFLNKLELDGIISVNNFPINTVYITPNNKFGLGKIDKNNNFFIEEFESISELEKNLKVIQNEQILICKNCKYQPYCLADRYFNPSIVDKNICNGYKDLIRITKGK